MLSRPSFSTFASHRGAPKDAPRYTVGGNCVSCMAAMRDAYDKMHAQHLASEAAETYKRRSAPLSGADGKQ